MDKPSVNSSTQNKEYELPLVIAVTGHRDLVADEIEPIRQRVKQLFTELKVAYPSRPLTILSSLAEGADQLVAEIAIEMSLHLIVPLPQRRELCVDDYKTSEARAQFESLCDAADRVFELAPDQSSFQDQDNSKFTAKEHQYAHMGSFLSAHCHILLAVWDGKPTEKLGGTGQVVRFHHDDFMPGYTSETMEHHKMLVDDESDLVFHIVCSRDREEGQPSPEFEALDWSWFTKDEHTPRTKELPKQHRTIFQRGSEFSADAEKYAEQIAGADNYLYEDGNSIEMGEGLSSIEKYFSMADWLAIHYQRRALLTIRVTHFLAFMMGLVFIVYSDLQSSDFLLYLFLLFFLMAAGLQLFSKTRAWQRKYLDYRTLAEGLRIQFYWAAAGVTNENIAKFAHDNFLQTQDPEFGWIRNVMRVSGTCCDAEPILDSKGLGFAEAQWVGDSDRGQLGYFERVAADRIKRHKITEALGRLSLIASVVVVFVLVTLGSNISDDGRNLLLVVMGTTLLLFAVREGYAYATAIEDLVKQYSFMLRIYKNARRRLLSATNESEKRQILQALGQSALDEHADWMLMHRDRSVRQDEIWRMGG